MAKFLMLGKYSLEAIEGIKAERTKKVKEIIKKNGGKIIGMYALLGPYDLAFIVDLPSSIVATKVSVAITKLTGIGFSTLAAFSVEEFDKIMG